MEFNLVTVALGGYNSDAGVGCKSLGDGELEFVGEGLVFAFAVVDLEADSAATLLDDDGLTNLSI